MTFIAALFFLWQRLWTFFVDAAIFLAQMTDSYKTILRCGTV